MRRHARGLAESWEFNEDRTSVTLKLKKDQKFSDGIPDHGEGSSLVPGLPDHDRPPGSEGQVLRLVGASATSARLKGAQEVFDGKVPADEFGAAMVEGIKVIDDSTIQLDFTQPVMTLTVEPLQFWMILKPESVMAGKGKEYGPDAYWTTEPGVVSSGPFMLDSFASGNGYTMVPNPNWAGKKPELSKIVVTLMSDYSTALSAFENKEADAVMMPLGPEDAQGGRKLGVPEGAA